MPTITRIGNLLQAAGAVTDGGIRDEIQQDDLIYGLPIDPRLVCGLDYKSRKLTSMVAATLTGLFSLRPGTKRH